MLRDVKADGLLFCVRCCYYLVLYPGRRVARRRLASLSRAKAVVLSSCCWSRCALPQRPPRILLSGRRRRHGREVEVCGVHELARLAQDHVLLLDRLLVRVALELELDEVSACRLIDVLG